MNFPFIISDIPTTPAYEEHLHLSADIGYFRADSSYLTSLIGVAGNKEASGQRVPSG